MRMGLLTNGSKDGLRYDTAVEWHVVTSNDPIEQEVLVGTIPPVACGAQPCVVHLRSLDTSFALRIRYVVPL